MNFNGLKQFILLKLESELPDSLHYHNVGHTVDVIQKSAELSKHYFVSEKEFLMLQTAALLHDIGYIDGSTDHELRSAEFAKGELPNWGYDAEEIALVCQLITATKIPQNPKTKMGEILCDADLSYLGTDQFKSIGDKLYEEFEKAGKVASYTDWNKLQVQFLKAHYFHTSFAKTHWEPKKQENLAALLREMGS